ncbi:helicase-related protein, partial [Alphaproteobacteria bacterium]|nr:helicase-related protein [Alphaproteobacteria bacterium]
MNEVDGNLVAILGPTNTGKTYLAFDRMMAYQSGIFGFPLRLLARENYDKAVKTVGINKVALVTGEEKFIPKEAKYFFCTVESIPKNLNVECVIIDEVQLASDYERGHIFTDNLLHTRGEYETIFLGSLTIKSLLLRMFPKVKIESKVRFSRLSFVSNKNFSKLKPRSAIIAFNINSLYEIAENLRSHRGGAAVVLGSLSPRTRNAQVEIYEDKKVDYLVATDAIGMGLNLNINHVAFSSVEKFDGRFKRNLYPNELGQIAGRAGRYENNGTFSLLKNAGELDIKTIQNIQDSNFDS